jgi:hypothetical protein
LLTADRARKTRRREPGAGNFRVVDCLYYRGTHSRQQMKLSRLEISSVFVGNMGFPTFFDEDFGFRYSNKGTRSCASYDFVAAFCDHLIRQSAALWGPKVEGCKG